MTDLVISVVLSGTSFVFTDENTENISTVLSELTDGKVCSVSVEYDDETYEGTSTVTDGEIIVSFTEEVALPSGMCLIFDCEDEEEDEDDGCFDVSEQTISDDTRLAVIDEDGCITGYTTFGDLLESIDYPGTLCELYGLETMNIGSLVSSDSILTIDVSDCSIKAIPISDISCSDDEDDDEDDDLSSITTRVGNLETSVNTLSSTVSSHTSSISSLNNSVDGLNDSISDISGQIDTLSDSIEEDVAEIGSDIDDIESSISTVNQKITSINTKLTSLSNSVDTNEESIDDLDSRVSTLEECGNDCFTELADRVTELEGTDSSTDLSTYVGFEITQWKAEPDDSQLQSGSTYNIMDGLTSDDKRDVSVTTDGALDITEDGDDSYIQMNWQGVVEYLLITVSIGLQQGGALGFTFDLYRKSDDSLIRSYPVYYDFSQVSGSVTAAVTINTYVASDEDPFVTDGFYILLNNSSGSVVNLQDTVNLMIQRQYMNLIERS